MVEKTEAIKAALTRAMQVAIGEHADVLLVNVEDFAGAETEINAAACPVIFYGFYQESRLQKEKHPAAPYFYRKNTAYFTVPFRLEEIRVVYRDILAGRKIENPAMMLLGKRDAREKLILQLLHDILPGKYGCEQGLETARREFGISGTIEKVRYALAGLHAKQQVEKSVKTITGRTVIPGVFCDIEGTLIVGGKINASVLKKLREYAATKPVTLWTGGSLDEAEKELTKEGIIDFPLVSKYGFEGCHVEVVMDDLGEKEFKERYHIAPQKYIKI
ncbi:hypothetical protein A2988_02355 [Candidatus Azambacteria bacterium RIFCSPLOWO2_01_FULL_46_25]|uniref:Uncharacterized protein n=1 Tax=Candidatus Azambacteria bacterium RIFCSPLOWO2_01_FULL_46_25 TaxID=1797298 RepID=A0A1F5BUQ5_9BACT|nr:MAG: hypothetical protein A2988_02355 [Candidatus Azambacteria bacterium RIFCSPLOWO2_01_FULL_46_25]OGD37375.1 MAG: hypothetical protein A2850_01530 [Candidatus Azambacteria bacterium RIFCSPHIGHO2_01_FULL_51_74]